MIDSQTLLHDQMSGLNSQADRVPVIVVGAGPVGLVTALKLAQHGIRCKIVERNLEASKWPKMDLLNCRSMELLRRMNIADEVRKIGVPVEYSLKVLFSTGFSDNATMGKTLTSWNIISPAECRDIYSAQPDGTLPQEPYCRGSQSLFETWLRDVCATAPLIDLMVGQKVEALVEEENGVRVEVTDVNGSTRCTLDSEYVIACDGARSQIRKTLNIKMSGGVVPMKLYLVHFRSTDLTRIQSQGQFWHIFYTNGGIIIAQDEIETWTAHLSVPIAEDTSCWDPLSVIYRVLGGSAGPYKTRVDEIIVSGIWRPNICVADKYRSKGGRVFLAGDSAHQTIPTGGYGGSTGLGDGYDIAWKLAAVINGFGGEDLLRSYEIERKPVAERNVVRGGVHMEFHKTRSDWVRTASDPSLVTTDSEEGAKLRDRLIKHIDENDREHKDLGTEIDYRFPESSVVVPEQDGDTKEPEWSPEKYTPSTWPGHRAPHILLSDGQTSIFDLYGLEFTIVDFSAKGVALKAFEAAAKKVDVPLTLVHLQDERHAQEIWERDAVLIRPDGYVAWRTPNNTDNVAEHVAKAALLTAAGRAEELTASHEPSTDTKGRLYSL